MNQGEIGTKLLRVLKDLPLWLIVGITIAVNIFLFYPQLNYGISVKNKSCLIFISILFTALTITRTISDLMLFLKNRKIASQFQKTFHLSPVNEECFWSSHKQSDDSILTQLRAYFTVKNCTQTPVSLVGVCMKNFLKKREVIRNSILIDYREIRRSTNDPFSGSTIPPGKTLPMSLSIFFRGELPQTKVGKPFRIKLCISDSSGNKQTVRVFFKSIFKPKELNQKRPLEVPSLMTDPIEKEIISILQLELCQYGKCGRNVGGLGSVYTRIPGQELKGVGCDSWQANSPQNQSISNNPEAADIKSDNLDALMMLYKRLTSEDEKKRFIKCLINRIDEHKGYLSVSYFIVYVLLKLGHLHEALTKVKSALPQGEVREFGFSNVLMLLNGLLRYRHPDFTAQKLDYLEQFISGLNEHTFLIAEKIAAIRASRLLDSKVMS